MKNKFLLMAVVIMFILNFISAVPPITTTQQFTTGYVIQIPQDNIIQEGKNYNFDFHVQNISDGQPITRNIGCYFHLYDFTGNHQFSGYDANPSFSFDYEFNLNASNFTTGRYYYYIQCNSSTLGGFSESILEVTPSGDSGTNNIIIFLLAFILLYCLNLIGFFGKNRMLTVLSGMSLMFLGVFTINNGIIVYSNDLTTYVAYITIAWGIITTFWSLFDLIKEVYD